ncbi:kidins220b, partial [Symbiodinium sp. KB8]
MSIAVEVSLLSGKAATVQAGWDDQVNALRLQALIALGVSNGRLVDSSGGVLDGSAPIKDSNIQNGDTFTLHVFKAQVQGNNSALAAILGDGSVVSWGDTANFRGGAVQDQLKNVQQIQTSVEAFAAILSDRSVVTWGYAYCGGDSGAVQDQLKNVLQLQAGYRAFAAILGDGSVVTWGDADCGGDSSAVREQLKNVRQIQASQCAFGAILDNGSVVTWGYGADGGDSSGVQDQLKNVQQIQTNDCAFAAILGDGSVVTWGDADFGGDSSHVQDQLKNVQRIQASCTAFAAILDDGWVVTWGDPAEGGDSSSVQDQLKNVQQIQTNNCAFAAILGDGCVVTWGDDECGGDSRAVQEQLKNVQQIQTSCSAFAAILDDGSVVTWGRDHQGGDSRAVKDQLKNVRHIQASRFAFAAILGDGAVVTWGDAAYGGDSSAVQDQLKNVQEIQAGHRAFAAILGDGSVVTWGDPFRGGDSGAVHAQEQYSRLMEGAQRNDVQAVGHLLEHGAVPRYRDASGWTPLHWAVLHEASEMSKLLVRYGASPELLGEESELCSQLASRGRRVGTKLSKILGANTRLLAAAEAADLASARQAVEDGACPDARQGVDGGGGGQAPRGGRGSEGPLSLLARQEEILQGAEVAAEMGAEPRGEGSGRNMTALMWAARHGLADMVRLLGTANADVNLRSALEGSDRCLLAADASIEERSIQGQTPLHVAAACGSTKCLLVLLHYGAKVAFKDKLDRTAILIAACGVSPKACEILTAGRLPELPELPIRLENENPVIQEARHEIRKKEGNGSELTEEMLDQASRSKGLLGAKGKSGAGKTVPKSPTRSSVLRQDSSTRRPSLTNRTRSKARQATNASASSFMAEAPEDPAEASQPGSRKNSVTQVSLTGSRKNSRETGSVTLGLSMSLGFRRPSRGEASATGTRALSSTDEASNDGSFSTKEETAFKEEVAPFGRELLTLAAERRQKKLSKAAHGGGNKVLLDTGDKGMTVLHYAVAAGRTAGHFRVLSKLVELKANCNAKEKNGRTPLMQAAAVGYAEAVERMLRDPSTKVADKDRGGRTAADHAASQHIQMMIERAMVQDRTGQPRKSLDFQDRSQLFPTDTTDKEDAVFRVRMEKLPTRISAEALENKIQVLLKKVVVRPVHMEVVMDPIMGRPRGHCYLDFLDSQSSEKALELDGLEV